MEQVTVVNIVEREAFQSLISHNPKASAEEIASQLGIPVEHAQVLINMYNPLIEDAIAVVGGAD